MLSPARNFLVRAEKEFEQGLATYNNVSFLILSLTGLVSSTILVVVTVKRASHRELMLVIVEGLIVVLFLFVVTHVLIVYTRADDYIVDYHVEQKTVHHYEKRNVTVRGFYERREVAVGKRTSLPILLISTEVCAVLCTLTVVASMVRLFLKRKSRNQEKHFGKEMDSLNNLHFSV